MKHIIKKEIGSEFWSAPIAHTVSPVWEQYIGDKRFFVSGRTALYAIIEQIKKSQNCQSAYLPSYCCESMVEPFIRHGIKVEFYDVYAQNGMRSKIDAAHKCDIVLTMDYFGYQTIGCQLPKAVHIHDVTHSVLTRPTYGNADYYFGSLRKWGAVAGAGFACKTIGHFLASEKTSEHLKYIALRNQGYKLKAQYMDSKEVDKQEFLSLFSQAEAVLDEDYIDYGADKESILAATHIGTTASVRTKNAEQLLNGLKNSKIVKPIYSVLQPGDVPLFVPVLVQRGLRNELKAFLIKNQVYCPVHWSTHNGCSGELYSDELSLICDQRYTQDDMHRETDLICEFEERYG